MRSLAARGAVLWAALLLGGCESTIAEGLDETQANLILVTLEAHEIGGDKQRVSAAGGDPSWEVRVSNDDVGPALAVLRAADLPRAEEPGFADVFGEGSLVPTATEERARYGAALAGELAASIEAIDGVLDARVHVAMPEPRDFALDQEPPRPRASVLIKHLPGAPPYDETQIRSLVAGAVHGMAPEDVAVVGVAGPREPVLAGSLVRVGPISVTRGSSFALKAVLGTALGLDLVLAAALIVLWTRRRRALPGPV